MRDNTDRYLMAQQIDGIRWPRYHSEFFNSDKVNHPHHKLIRIKHFRRAFDNLGWYNPESTWPIYASWLCYEKAEHRLINLPIL